MGTKKNIKKKSMVYQNKYISIVEFVTLLAIFTIVLWACFQKPKIEIGKRFYKVADRTEEIKKYEKEQDYTIVGWIKIQGTNIDYPVLFYDNAPISDVRQNIGWTYRNTKKLDRRTVIEGHNILNLSSNPKIASKDSKRFEQLLSFYDPKFVKDNKYIQYTFKGENYVFKIFSVGLVGAESYYTQYEYTDEEFKSYLEKSRNDSLFDFDVDVDETDKIISVYTCTRFYGYGDSVSFRIDGRLLRDKEKIKNYDMKTTDNYTKAKAYSDSRKKAQEVQS